MSEGIVASGSSNEPTEEELREALETLCQRDDLVGDLARDYRDRLEDP